MTDRFAGFGRPRAFACVIRHVDEAELLVFEHPHEGIQIPKGRIDSGESSKDASVRELAEESGLNMQPSRFLGRLETLFEHPDDGSTVREDWHIWMFEAGPSISESWVHHAEEENLDFRFHWIALDESTRHVVHAYLGDVVDLTRCG